jgi:hypothetical protein
MKKTIVIFEKTAMRLNRYMCKELPVISVNREVYKKRINGGKMEGRGGGKAQGVADPKTNKHMYLPIIFQSSLSKECCNKEMVHLDFA